MAAALKPGWSKPSTILFASEIPANQKAFAFALAQAQEFASDLILFHAYDTLVVAASEASGIRYYDYAAAARSEKQHLEPLAQRAREAGIHCEVVVRPGLPADEILHARARNRTHRDGHALAGPHRQVVSRFCG
jgi:nucleotide-binding universal stress UspA family protein